MSDTNATCLSDSELCSGPHCAGLQVQTSYFALLKDIILLHVLHVYLRNALQASHQHWGCSNIWKTAKLFRVLIFVSARAVLLRHSSTNRESWIDFQTKAYMKMDNSRWPWWCVWRGGGAVPYHWTWSVRLCRAAHSVWQASLRKKCVGRHLHSGTAASP
jgi:hypothetical protein